MTSYDVKWPDGATNMEKLREDAKKHIYNDHSEGDQIIARQIEKGCSIKA